MPTGTENCPSFFDCDKAKNMTLETVIKDMIIDDGNGCPVLRTQANTSVSATVSTPLESAVTSELIESAEAVNSKTLGGLMLAYQAWKTLNPTRRVVRETPITGPEGFPGIIISHTA